MHEFNLHFMQSGCFFIFQIINTGSNANKILDASNRFYTLIPHDFGLKSPPKLDNEDLIKVSV